MLKLRSRSRADLSFVGLERRAGRVRPGSPARRGEGHRGHAGHTWGPAHPSAPGPGRAGARGRVPGSSPGGARPRRWARRGDRGQARGGEAAPRPADSSRSPGGWLTARERKWLLGGRQPQAGRCGADPRFPSPPSRVGRAHRGAPAGPRPPGRAGLGAEAVGASRGRGGAARGVPSPSRRSPPASPLRSAPRRRRRPIPASSPARDAAAVGSAR